MNPILEVRDVTGRFGGLLAVSDVSFSMAEGTIMFGGENITGLYRLLVCGLRDTARYPGL